ncbi:Fanconi anemia group M protein [Hoplias malabaricus]|uniref:Fanconi anemia group M protein n=1 Tax=Hoplias malabaricus TaxID=27720 RepID=UPI003461B9D4
MSSAHQRTLFQTWGASESERTQAVRTAPRRRNACTINDNDGRTKKRENENALLRGSLWTAFGQGVGSVRSNEIPQEDTELDDDLLLIAADEAEKSLESSTEAVTNDQRDSTDGNLDLQGYDSSSGKVWIYPTNFPVRDYQLKMSEAGLFQNTLVCLPTGLGKTFIAAVVMYNFYRWYPSGKIVFMAPTKPLVAQQIEACYKVMGIPQQHMAELTGSTPALQRCALWRSKRIFFLTPQVMINDLSRNTCPGHNVKCLVIDEAHKALGNHAYCQVVRELWNQTKQFRVLALSATPGGDVKAVQQIISNLLISHIELRTEESPDIQAHSHHRSLEKIVVPLGESLTKYQTWYLQVLEKFTSRLTQMRVLSHRDIRTITKYQLILAREQFRRNPPPHVKGAQQGVLEGDFALCISLYHGYELLQQMGLRSLFLFTQNIMLDSKDYSRARNELQRTPVFMDLYKEMEAVFLTTATKGPGEQYIYSHPKLEKLEEVVLQHFRTWSANSGNCSDSGEHSGGINTRVMIFSSFRESVQEIAELLNRHQPLIRVMTFMGQASAGKGVRGFTQKEQLEVVQKFKNGGFNTLVSTCVGEEGLDIGEVDLIVCFDAQKSPIRLVQRMGRTGRHRHGRIVVILAEGREERTYNQSQSNRRNVIKCIMGNKHSFHMFPHSPRMLPVGFTPTLHKMHITCGSFEHKDTSRRSMRGSASFSRERLHLLNPSAHGGGEQERVKTDGFLTPAEQAVWVTNMKLCESVPQPVLKQSSFLSFGGADPQTQDMELQGLVRDLSLWEWRHWQNQPLPTHRVEHSNRCFHFIAVMDLIDRMKLEDEGDCRYDSELTAYLHEEDVTDSSEDRMPKRTSGKGPQQKRCIAKFVDQDMTLPKELTLEENNKIDHIFSSSLTLIKYKDSYDSESDIIQDEDLCAFQCTSDGHESNAANGVLTDVTEYFKLKPSVPDEQLLCCSNNQEGHVIQTNHDPAYNPQPECPTPEKMFYPPVSSVGTKPPPLKPYEATFRILLSNVRRFLSRPPPDIFDLNCSVNSEPIRLDKPKETSYCAMEDIEQVQDNDSLEKDHNSTFGDTVTSNRARMLTESHCSPEIHLKPVLLPDKLSPCLPPVSNSPSWEVIFDDELEETEADKKTDPPSESKKQIKFTNLDESVDLFGDDEAFLQVSLPIIETPKKASVSYNRGQDSLQRGKITSAPDPSMSLQMPNHSQLTPQQTSEVFDTSQDIFSVNFDLGYSFDSMDEEEPVERAPGMTTTSVGGREQTFTSFTMQSREPNLLFGHASTPRVCPRDREAIPSPMAKPKLSPIITERKNLVKNATSTTAFASPEPKNVNLLSKVWSSQAQLYGRGQTRKTVFQVPGHSELQNSDSEEEEVIHKCGHQKKAKPLASQEEKIYSDVDSPIQGPRKRVTPLITSEHSEDESEYQFHQTSFAQPHKGSHGSMKFKKAMHREGRQFLEEEAEVSEGDFASSDEYDGEEQDKSLQGFVVDTTQFSQGLNDAEMQGVYLKSVKSPAMSSKFRMVYKPMYNVDIFSQVPEENETYMEDSFVVNGSENEEICSTADEDKEAAVEIIPEDPYVDGRKIYATRRRVQLRKTLATGETTGRQVPQKIKRRRIVRIEDSSESEEEWEGKKRKGLHAEEAPISKKPDDTAFKVQQLHSVSSPDSSHVIERRIKQSNRQKFNNQAPLSEKKDFEKSLVKTQTACAPSSVGNVSIIQAPGSSACVSILVDSRCIISGPEVVSSLRLKHGTAVQVCSLVTCDFIVSKRMAVEWQSESELASAQNRKRLQERIQSLQAVFDRVCFIVEKDRTKPGEPLRSFQRSHYYDSTVAALVKAGIRMLFSQSAEDTATLLAELAQVEQRKGQAISVPLEVTGPRQQAMQFYLTLPCVTYINALYMCHNFSSVSHLVNSSVDELQEGSCISHSRAEQIYHSLHYSCDTTLMKTA